jgi:hypothetical protein
LKAAESLRRDWNAVWLVAEALVAEALVAEVLAAEVRAEPSVA